MRFAITNVRADFLSKARAEGLDDQGQMVRRLIAAGGEPCRDALRRALPGEDLILASYCPFKASGPYREYGPVFILAGKSGDEPQLDRLPLTGSDGRAPYLREQFVLRAYGESEEILAAKMVTPETAPATIDEMFSDPRAAFIHARFPTYGCYALRIDRR